MILKEVGRLPPRSGFVQQGKLTRMQIPLRSICTGYLRRYGYVMENGKIVMEGAADDLKENPDVKEFYLGTTATGDKKSYEGVKSYKRRKRWL